MKIKLEYQKPSPVPPEIAAKIKLWSKSDFEGLPKWEASPRMRMSNGQIRPGILQKTVYDGKQRPIDVPVAEYEYMVDLAGNVTRLVVRSNGLDANDLEMREYGAEVIGAKDVVIERKRRKGWLSVFNPNMHELTWAGALINGEPDMDKYISWLTDIINARRAAKYETSQRFVKESEQDKLLKVSQVSAEAIADKLTAKYSELFNAKTKRSQAKDD